MKPKLSLSVFSLVIAFSASALNYNQFAVDGIIYEKITGTSNVKVTYDPDKATKDQFSQPIGNTYSGVVTVPETVTFNNTTYTVTEIGDFAFAGGPGLTGVILPETITKIGSGAFYGNEGLTSMTLPNSIKELGFYSFRNCYNLSSINFPEGLEVIGGDAFTHDRTLTELILPSSLKQIDDYAFCACTGIKRVVMQDSDVPLAKNSYYGCQTIFDQMEVDYAYIGRTCYTDDVSYRPIRIKAKELDFGDAVSSFSLSQFYPDYLEKLSIPATCDKLYYADFQNSTALKHIVIKDGTKPIILDTYVKRTSTGNGGTSYEYFPCFINCPLETAYVGRTFQQEYGLDGTQAFYSNKTLKHLVIGPLVTSLPKYGFQRCEGLESVEFPESLTAIGDACFADCHSLKSVKLPPLLTEIAPRVFDSCFDLTDVTFSSKVTSIGEMAFYYCGLTDIKLPSSVSTIGQCAFSGIKSITSITLPEGVQTIESRAFSYCENVTELIIPASVTHIKRDAFSYLTSLKSIKFSDSADELYIDIDNVSSGIPPVFSNSIANLENIYLGKTFVFQYKSGNDYITPDYRNLFGTYGSFDSAPIVTFGPKVTYAPKSLFSNFRNIKKVYCQGTTTIPWYNSTFLLPSQIKVYVPQGYAGKYETYGWTGFASVQENVKATRITLNSTYLSLKKGTSLTLTATVSPSNASDAEVMWESSDESAVTVSESGEVTAIGIGQASVTAYLPNYPELWATCNVTVTRPDVSAFSFDKKSETIFVDTQTSLTLTIDPSDASQEFTVKTSAVEGKNLGSIDYTIDGNVITVVGKAPGFVAIEAVSKTNAEIKCSAEITVCDLNLSSDHIVLGKEASYALTPVISPEISDLPGFNWTSSDPGVATVNSDGTVKGVASGVATITLSPAGFPSISASCEVEVGTLFDRNVIVEAAVSTQEIWSVRGYAGLDMYKSLSGEAGKVIPIAVHVNFNGPDPMSGCSGSYSEELLKKVTGIPEFLLNREVIAPTPTSADKRLFFPNQAQQIIDNKSICGFEIINATCPDNIQNKTPLTASLGIYPGRDITEKLTIAAVIVENGVSGIASQKNTIYCNQTASDMTESDWQWMSPYCSGGKWGQETIPSSTMTYDHVARGIYPSFNGKEAGDSWTEGACYGSNISFELPSNIRNLENCELIVMLLDSKGRVVNASSMPYSQFQVTQTEVSDMTLNKSSLNLQQGTSETLTVTVSPSYINNPIIAWTSSNDSVATVVDGTVTAVGAGKATITAATTDGSNINRSCEVSVYPSSIAFNATDITLFENETFQLTPNVPSDYLSGANILWSSSDSGVITVDQSGLITAQSKGHATVILTISTPSGQIAAECNVTVNRVATEIAMSATETSIEVGSTYQLSATISPSDVFVTAANWSSDNEEVATVDSTGKVQAIKQGVAHITATTTDGTDLSASCLVTVVQRVKTITLSDNQIVMNAGETATITASVNPDNATNPALVWTSSDALIASVQNGLILAHAEGEAIITAAATDGSGVKAECKVIVTRASGIDSVNWADVKVYSSESTIYIDSLPSGVLTRIIQPNGFEIFRTESTGERISFRPAANGVYFVIIGPRSHKLVVD